MTYAHLVGKLFYILLSCYIFERTRVIGGCVGSVTRRSVCYSGARHRGASSRARASRQHLRAGGCTELRARSVVSLRGEQGGRARAISSPGEPLRRRNRRSASRRGAGEAALGLPPRAVLERDVAHLSSSAMASRAAPRAGRARARAPAPARRVWTSTAFAILALTFATCTVRAPSRLLPPRASPPPPPRVRHPRPPASPPIHRVSAHPPLP